MCLQDSYSPFTCMYFLLLCCLFYNGSLHFVFIFKRYSKGSVLYVEADVTASSMTGVPLIHVSSYFESYKGYNHFHTIQFELMQPAIILPPLYTFMISACCDIQYSLQRRIHSHFSLFVIHRMCKQCVSLGASNLFHFHLIYMSMLLKYS